MNDENLKRGVATQFRSGEEAARNGQKGGIASGEARRVCGSLREALAEELKRVRGDGGNGYEAIVRTMLNKAIHGDVKAAALIYKMSGEDILKISQDAPPPIIANIFARDFGDK